MARPGAAFTVYNCENPDNPVTAINLQEPGPCAEALDRFDEPREVQAQVAQTHTTGTLNVIRCKVVNTRQATSCGFTSISYASVYTAWEDTVQIPAKECREAAATGIIQIDNQDIPVHLGSTTSATYYPYGGTDAEGNCQNAAFTDMGRHFKAHYLRVSVAILVEKWTVPMDPFQTFTNLGSTGLKVRTGDGYVHDGREGSFVYAQNHNDKCEEEVSGIYQGPVTLFQKKKTVEGSYLTIRNETTGQLIGARLGKRKTVCGHSCYDTQINDLNHSAGTERSTKESGKSTDGTVRPHFRRKSNKTR